MKRLIKFGSRKSLLAVAQTKLVMKAVAQACPELETELVTLDTSGDMNMKPFSDSSDKFGIKGLFTQELESALRDRSIDVAVHSLKDVPSYLAPDLPIMAYSKREDPSDVVVLPNGGPLAGAPAGCSSSRRRLQLKNIFPDAEVAPVRGDVITRLKKLDEGQFSMLILAAAGLIRLGLQDRISRRLSVDEMTPAPGQGVLACQCRADSDHSYLDAVNDENAAMCVRAERAFSEALGGGCTSPVGAFAETDGETIYLRGFYADENSGAFRKGSLRGGLDDAADIGKRLAEQLKQVNKL